MAIEQFGRERVLGLFCDTSFEHPDTYWHVDYLQCLYGVQIAWVNAGSTVLDESVRFKRFPGGGSRHCTDELKIRQTRLFLKHLSHIHGGFEVWYGMRSDESTDRATRYKSKVSTELYAPHDVLPKKYPRYLAKRGVVFRLPILDWSKEQVFERLEGKQHPHYALGFERVGCFPCLASGDAHKEKAFAFDDFGAQQKARVAFVSARIKKSIWTSKSGIERNKDSSGCSFCEY